MKNLIPILALGSCLLAADVNRGVNLYKEGKYGAAESELEKAVSASEEDATAHRYLGFALLGQKKFDEAERHLKRAAELDSGAEAKGALARLHAEKADYAQAQSALEGASGPDADYARGLVQLDKKQYAEAVKNIESFISAEPNYGYAHYHAGLAYNGLRRKDKMLSEFEMFLRMMPDAPEARKVRAVMQTGR